MITFIKTYLHHFSCYAYTRNSLLPKNIEIQGKESFINNKNY